MTGVDISATALVRGRKTLEVCTNTAPKSEMIASRFARVAGKRPTCGSDTLPASKICVPYEEAGCSFGIWKMCTVRSGPIMMHMDGLGGPGGLCGSC